MAYYDQIVVNLLNEIKITIRESMKKLCIIFSSLALLPAFARDESPLQSAKRETSWFQSTKVKATWVFLLTCCPDTSKQILAHLLCSK